MHQEAIKGITSADDAAIPATPTAAVPEHLRGFVRENRLARPSTAATTARLALVVAAWVVIASAGLRADRWFVWAPVWVALAFLTATPLALMHEAVHHNLFGSRAVNHAVGTVAAACLFFHGPAYRAWHLTHHAYTFAPEDSEQLPDQFSSRLHYLGYCLVLGPAFAVVLWAGAVATALGRPPAWVGTRRLQQHVRRWAVAPLLVLAAVGVLVARAPVLVLELWLIPAVLGSLVVFPLLTMPEHFQGKGRNGLLHNTRTTVSNRVVRAVYWNNNFHTAHHLVPTVPPQGLPLLDAQIASGNTLRASGFLTFHRDVLQDLRPTT
ncbi:MAG TPA: fatty acid desaturase [Acidimicrobiales bacterium]|nr:fatty acid desaturase [Acidimicrobiales bacterium]